MLACTGCSLKTAVNKLKILFLNSIDKKVWGGLEHWMEMCGLGLVGAGYDVCFAGRSDSLFQERMAEHDQVDFIPLDISGDFSPRSILQLRRIIKQRRIDAVMCNFVKDVRLAGLARKLNGDFKIIWTPGVNLAKRSLSHRFLFSSWLDGVIVPSNYLRSKIVNSGYIPESKFRVIPIGIDEGYWHGDREAARGTITKKHNLPSDAFICLTSGRFVNQKGHKYLIESAVKLKEKCENIYFIFLGDGPLQPELDNQIEKSGLTKRFIFPGLLSDHRDYLFASDLYVHPAITEPYGIVLVEAMAANLPIVASSVGGIPDVVAEGENALLCPPKDTDALTDAVSLFYNESEMRLRYGQKSKERFDHKFHLSAMIDLIEQVIQETIRG